MTRKKKNETQSSDTLKRSDVVRKLHHELGFSSTESAKLTNDVFRNISEALIDGEDVKLAGFGTFKILHKAARLGRNPKTGEECIIGPRKVLTFKPSAFMRERVESALMTDPVNAEAGISEMKSSIENRVAERPLKAPNDAEYVSVGKPKIRRKEWIALFELLGSFAFAETPFQAGKTEAFIQSVLEIKTIIDPTAAVTRKTISSWARLNRNRWAKWLGDETLVLRFKANLATLKNISHRSDIIFAMVRIAVAENEYTELQKSLIAHTILAWDMPGNIISDIEYVCPEIIPDLQKIL